MTTATNYTLTELRKIAATNASIAAFSYEADFADIWAHAESGFPESLHDVFVIWDGVPQTDDKSETPARNFLTVFDWVAAITVVAGDVKTRTHALLNHFNFRLHILIAYGDGDLPNALSLRTIPLLHKTVAPWVKIYPSYSGDAFLDAAETDTRDEDHMSVLEFVTSPGPQAQRATDLIRDLWVAYMTRADTRHAVSNTIGPIALAQCLKADGFRAADAVLDAWIGKAHKLNSAFWRLLEIFALVPPYRELPHVTKPRSALGGLTDDPVLKSNLFGQFDQLRFVLVDDQADSGFHDALGAFLLGPNPIQEAPATGSREARLTSRSNNGRYALSSYTRPNFLLSWLAQADQAAPFAITPFGRSPDASEEGLDVLFLDLRLHGISDTTFERDSERSWTKQLLELSQHLIARAEADATPAQIGALRRAIGAAERSTQQTDERDSSLAQLALLPIAISIYDPTQPIVLFSSTRQKAVLEMLSLFPNIDTRFSKPAITGYAQEDRASLSRCGQTLAEVLKRALEMHERRAVWKLVANFPLDAARAPPCAISQPLPEDRPQAHFDGRDWTLANGTSSQDLPLLSNRIFQRKFRDIFRDFVIGDDALETLFKPYEFIESCLTAEYQRQTKSESAIDYRFTAFNSFSVPNAIPGTRQRAIPIQWIKKARHAFAHGKFSASDEDPLLLRYLSFLALVQLSRGIGTDKVGKRVKALHDTTQLLLVAQMLRPTDSDLKTDWDDLKTIWANSPPLARAVAELSEKIWPWGPMARVVNSQS